MLKHLREGGIQSLLKNETFHLHTRVSVGRTPNPVQRSCDKSGGITLHSCAVRRSSWPTLDAFGKVVIQPDQMLAFLNPNTVPELHSPLYPGYEADTGV